MFAREWRSFCKSRIFWIVLAATWFSLGLGAWNGYHSWSSSVTQARLLNQQIETTYTRIRAMNMRVGQLIASGSTSELSPAQLEYGPHRALWVNGNNPPTSVLPAAPLAFLATGRSDTLPRSYSASPWRGLEPNAPTTDDPVALWTGDFDVNFVVLSVLPLILALSCFDLLANEQEDGTLRLILAQPVSFRKLLLCRASVRFALVAGSFLVTVVTLAAAVVFAGGAIWIGRVAAYTTVTLAYLCLWLLIAISVNLLGRSGTTNSLLLGATWVAMVVVVPGITPVIAEALTSTPSRALYIELARQARWAVYNATPDPATTKQRNDAMLAAFFKRHPEWEFDPTASRPRLFNAAQGEDYTAMVSAVTSKFDVVRQRQQTTIRRFSMLSFSAVTDEILTGLSGNSEARQMAFLEQSLDFFAASKRYFWPLIFHVGIFKPEQFPDIPRFKFVEPGTKAVLSPLWFPGSVLALWCAVAALVTLRQIQRTPVL